MAAKYAYMTDNNPWGNTENDTAMNTAFGAGAWQKYNDFSASVFTAGHDFIYINGSDSNSLFPAFYQANKAAIEKWVADGGELFIDAARNYGGGDVSLGFGGITLRQEYNKTGYAAAGAGDLFNANTNGDEGTTWTGNWFGHDIVFDSDTKTGPALRTLISDAANGGDAILATLDFGLGKVVFGGMTTPNYHTPTQASKNLLANVLDYTAAHADPNVAPVAANDAFATDENVGAKLDVLKNDTDANKTDVLTITSAIVKDGLAGATIALADNGKFVFFDPNKAYDHLSAGETATVKLGYTISDGHGGTASAEAVVTVQGVNDAPTDISLSKATVAENAKGAVIGTLATADVDAHDTHAYSITGVTNAKGEAVASNPFEIVNGALKVKDGVALDYETDASYSVSVKSDDGHGGTVVKTFDVAVSDDASDNGWGAGFQLTSLNDWYNPSWGGGFNASFSYTVQASDLKDGDVYAWEILPKYTGKGAVANAWTSGFNATVATVATGSNGGGEFALHTDGQAFKQKLVAGDVVNFSVQVQGSGYDKKDFAFDFNDLDVSPVGQPKATVAIEAGHTNDWGSGLNQQVALKNVGATAVDHWQVELDVADGVNVDVTGVWGASVEKQADGDLVFTSLGWNGAIGQNGTANFGFNASYNGASGVQFHNDDFRFVADAQHGLLVA